GLAGRERLALDRAARRIVLGIDIDDQPAAGEIAEPDRLAVLVGERERREGRTDLWKWHGRHPTSAQSLAACSDFIPVLLRQILSPTLLPLSAAAPSHVAHRRVRRQANDHPARRDIGTGRTWDWYHDVVHAAWPEVA